MSDPLAARLWSTVSTFGRAALSIGILASAIAAVVGSSHIQAADLSVSELADLSLEQLMDIEVTSVSRKEQRVGETAVAVHVITQEDIRRSGATSLAEVLRLAPGVTVARLDANKWTISIRGFVDRYANKLLVLVDGRSVYTPLFSGVFWDVQDLLLEDVERIEVIRGPGATLWGANAVNGIINVITKKAPDTQGALLVSTIGSEDREIVGARYGLALGERAHARVYAKHFSRDAFVDDSGASAGDGWHAVRSGFRVDRAAASSELTLHGDVYGGAAGGRAIVWMLQPPGKTLPHEDIRFSGGNLLGRWSLAPSASSEIALQLYFDHTRRSDAIHRELRNTLDLDFQHRFRLRHLGEIVWGLEGRVSDDDIIGRGDRSIDPLKQREILKSAFLQSETAVYGDRVRLMVGTKLEHKNTSGFTLQPSARLLFKVSSNDALWMSVSRAVRTPSRTERGMKGSFEVLSGQAQWPILVVVRGNPEFGCESLVAFEAGYRLSRSERLYMDAALYYNDYRDLRTFEPDAITLSPDPPTHGILTYRPKNLMSGQTFGGEFVVNWRPVPRWKLTASYSHFQGRLLLDPASADPWSRDVALGSPRHQASLRSSLDLPHRVSVDMLLNYASAWRQDQVEAISRVDFRLGWRPSRKLELSATAQNAFNNRFYETRKDLLGARALVEKNVYVKLALAF